jgi:3-oxoacyl-[acyl-carrier protein] reductase
MSPTVLLRAAREVSGEHLKVGPLDEFARRYVARGAKWGRIHQHHTGGAECLPGEVSYGASKNVLESYTRAAGKELARFGVTANLIVPGATQTGWITAELEKIILPDLPAGRIGQPEGGCGA